MLDDGDIPNRKKRDPVMMIGSIILAAAFIVVISGHAYGQIVPPDRDPVEYGDRVQVNYVGSFYGWYDGYNGNGGFDGGKGVIFDTSLWSVANNDANKFSWEFDKREERHYTPFVVNVGSNGALMLFENALIGMKPGETKRIMIFAADGYGELSDEDTREMSLGTTTTIEIIQIMTDSEFRLTFGQSTVATGFYSNLSHPYGWKSNAVVNTDGSIVVTHLVDRGGEYDAGVRTFDAENGMKALVEMNDDGTFTVGFDFPDEIITHYNADENDDRIQLIEFIFEGKKYYITEIGEDNFIMKSTSEIIGMTLYFVITVV